MRDIADTEQRMKRTSALDRIVSAFADAVAAGDYEQAEGWISVARDSYERSADAPHAPRASDRSTR
jgi:iron uptake system EfeUOB component EfeO/EfeM